MSENKDIKYEMEKMDINKLEEDEELKIYTDKVKVPPPPKKGELLVCQYCGQPIYPKELSKNPDKRKRELKWHVHNRCFNGIHMLVDQHTPGLWRERYDDAESSKLYKLIGQEIEKVRNSKK